MTDRKSPPHGYYISDCEKEIQNACQYFESLGLSYTRESDFSVNYVSNELVISISFERYYGTLFIDYYLPGPDSSPPNPSTDQRFSLIWTLALFDNGKYKEKYLPHGSTKIQQIEGCVKFFRDFKENLTDRDFAEKMRAQYDVVSV